MKYLIFDFTFFILQYYLSFQNVVEDPKEYVVMSNCSSNEDFEKELGKREFIYGGQETVMTVYTYEDSINKYFKQHPECTLKYEEFSILMKLLSIQTTSLNNDEYIVKLRNNTVKEGKLEEILSGLDYYIKEGGIKKHAKSTKESNTIDHEKILTKMKENTELFRKIKRRLSNEENNNITQSKHNYYYRILHSDNLRFNTSKPKSFISYKI